MMNYRHKNNKKVKKILSIVLVVVLFLVLASFFSTEVKSSSAGVVHGIGYPFWKTKVFLSDAASSLSAFFKSRTGLVSENKELKDELFRLKLQALSIDSLRKENEALKSLSGRDRQQSSIPAMVLSAPPQSGYDVLVLDVGENSGLKVGEKVYFENVLLGEISEVFERTSRATLYSSGGTELEAFIDRIDLLLKATGRGGGNFDAVLPEDAPVEIGDVIVVPGTNKYVLGQVGEIEETPTSYFKKILFRFPFNVSELRWVTVEKF